MMRPRTVYVEQKLWPVMYASQPEAAAPAACEMCGQLLGQSPDYNTGLQQVVRYLADLWVEHQDAPAIILAKVAFPNISDAKIARMMRRTRASSAQHVFRTIKEVSLNHSELLRVMRPPTNKTLGQQERRMRERNMKGYSCD